MTSEVEGVEVVRRRRVVVAALPLARRARTRLAERLGDARVVDIRDDVDRADLVLAPACSPQTISALKDAYPTALVVVAEIEDWEWGIDLPGPVKRLLAAGADGYVTADSLDELAEHLAVAPASALDDDGAADVRSLPPQSVDHLILATLAERLRAARPLRRTSGGGDPST